MEVPVVVWTSTSRISVISNQPLVAIHVVFSLVHAHCLTLRVEEIRKQNAVLRSLILQLNTQFSTKIKTHFRPFTKKQTTSTSLHFFFQILKSTHTNISVPTTYQPHLEPTNHFLYQTVKRQIPGEISCSTSLWHFIERF
ncbi:hypothetical protein Ddye_026401 [Dipteronia dyeriana]|uniref:Uncharacterized protein n=1 Tax=Dipteronia dyeriana TaxID=168575 RepID=A0AAD9TM71_9ROSI|nr:hypothetical protein Ddye_026401 [Dipteronia dyeriana]